MFDRFNDNARRILLVAQESAREMSHGHIGPEHLLYALLVTEGSPRRTLLAAGMEPSETRRAVDDIAGGAGRGVSGPHLPFSALAKRALEMSLREAIALSSSVLTPEHLLLGLVADADGPAARMIVAAGSTVDAVRADVLQSLAEEREDDHPAVDVFSPAHAVSVGGTSCWTNSG
jgi:ATP-dependent Clp protease ATP-binding subunit ClpC